MEEKQFENDKMNKKLELTVLSVFTVFSLAMSVSAVLLEWGILAKELIIAAVIAGWVVSWKEYRDYVFRAKFIALMCWINFFIYVIHSSSFTSMLSSMMALIVLLSIFCVPEIIYIGVFFTTGICLYHIVVLRSFPINAPNDALRLVLHIASAYVISLVVWITIRIREETSEKLIENIRELEIVEKSKDDFMVNISHEIRTPINAVCGMSEALLQEELPVDVRRDIVDIQTAGRNLLATVSNILDFSELESGKMELAEESYNITSTITDIINMAMTFENGKQLELIVDCDASLPGSLLGDEQKLRRIVMNLLENAMKFTKEGGVVLRIKSRKEEYGINLMVSVRDSGVGMSQAEIERVFTSYGQLDAKRNREEGGVGLGLSIAQALVQRMGGFITVESAPGIGTEFLFTVPQKVLDETPIVSIRNKGNLFAACYINMDKYNFSVVREGYERAIRHMAEQFGILFRICRNLPELKRRVGHENYSHVFISYEEYCEDKAFFENLAKELTVVLILDYGQENQVGSGMLRIYKPFTVLSIAAVFNGQKTLQDEERHGEPKRRFIAPEARVLVVDDNAMNLKVMARLLLPYRIKVVMASGGQEALHKLDTMDYDCVFLDHMMPEMDGVETLHRIRKKPGAYFQSLNVIAFTANAIGGAREMFMEEGFNDFIAKPIELSVLERMLRRYIPVQKQIETEEEAMQKTSGKKEQESATEQEKTTFVPPEQTEKTEEESLNDLSSAGVNIGQGIAYCGDKEGFREIAGIFYKEGQKRIRQLERLFEERDWTNYVITVHALKGNSKGIGANELSELALNLETAGKEERVEYIEAHHAELMEKYELLLRVLGDNAFIRQEETARETEEITAETLGERIGLLREKLDSFESEGLPELLEQLANSKCGEQAFAKLAEEIREKVEEFDFPGAAEVLEAWEKSGENIG